MNNVNFFKLGYGTKRQRVKYQKPFSKITTSILKTFVENEKKAQQISNKAKLGVNITKLDPSLESKYRSWALGQTRKYIKALNITEGGEYSAESEEFQNALRDQSLIETSFENFNTIVEKIALDKQYLLDPSNQAGFGGPSGTDNFHDTDESNRLILDPEDANHLFANATILPNGDLQYKDMYGNDKLYKQDYTGKYAPDLEDNFQNNSIKTDNYMFQMAQSNVNYDAIEKSLNARITSDFNSVGDIKQRRYDILTDEDFLTYRLNQIYGGEGGQTLPREFTDEFLAYKEDFNYAEEANEFLFFKLQQAKVEYNQKMKLLDRKTGRKNPQTLGKISLGRISFTGADDKYQGLFLGYVERERVKMFNKDLENLKLNGELPHLLDNGFVVKKVQEKDQEKAGEIPNLYEIYLDGNLYIDNNGDSKFTLDKVKLRFGTGGTTEAFLDNPY